jgi:hypothetical protein
VTSGPFAHDVARGTQSTRSAPLYADAALYADGDHRPLGSDGTARSARCIGRTSSTGTRRPAPAGGAHHSAPITGYVDEALGRPPTAGVAAVGAVDDGRGRSVSTPLVGVGRSAHQVARGTPVASARRVVAGRRPRQRQRLSGVLAVGTRSARRRVHLMATLMDRSCLKGSAPPQVVVGRSSIGGLFLSRQFLILMT